MQRNRTSENRTSP